MEIPPAIIFSGLLEGSIYALLGLGMSMIIGVMRIVNSAHGDLMVFAAFVNYWTFTILGLDPFITLLLSIPILFLLGVVIQGLIVAPTIRLAENQMTASMVVTFSLALLISQTEFIVWTPTYRVITTDYSSWILFLGGMNLNAVRVATLFSAILVAVMLHLILTKTMFGKSMRACKDERDAAMMMGVNFGRVALKTFGLSSALAAIAGLFFIMTHTLNPGLGINFTVKAFVVLIIGGMGSVVGPLVAGLMIGVIENLAGFVIGGIYKDTVTFIVLLIILTIRPTGILGRVEA